MTGSVRSYHLALVAQINCNLVCKAAPGKASWSANYGKFVRGEWNLNLLLPYVFMWEKKPILLKVLLKLSLFINIYSFLFRPHTNIDKINPERQSICSSLFRICKIISKSFHSLTQVVYKHKYYQNNIKKLNNLRNCIASYIHL